MSKRVHLVLTKGEIQELLNIVCGAEEELNKDSLGRPRKGKKQFQSLVDKVWEAWADVHPEEGPFK